jgi:hypothetical protein
VNPKQRAIDALIAKYREQLRLIPADMLPAPAYDFDPKGWLLFRVDPEGASAATNSWRSTRLAAAFGFSADWASKGHSVARAFSRAVTTKKFPARLARRVPAEVRAPSRAMLLRREARPPRSPYIVLAGARSRLAPVSRSARRSFRRACGLLRDLSLSWLPGLKDPSSVTLRRR